MNQTEDQTKDAIIGSYYLQLTTCLNIATRSKNGPDLKNLNSIMIYTQLQIQVLLQDYSIHFLRTEIELVNAVSKFQLFYE